MTKTLTIELPDNLEERLDILANAVDDSLEKLIFQTLQTLVTSMQSLHDASSVVRVKAVHIDAATNAVDWELCKSSSTLRVNAKLDEAILHRNEKYP